MKKLFVLCLLAFSFSSLADGYTLARFESYKVVKEELFETQIEVKFWLKCSDQFVDGFFNYVDREDEGTLGLSLIVHSPAIQCRRADRLVTKRLVMPENISLVPLEIIK